MRLTTHTDYALRVLIYLGLAPDRMATIREISMHYNISRNHLMKIVQELGQAGYIKTVRGRNGGIRLGRVPDAVCIGDVVRSMEDSMHIVECFNPEASTCHIVPACILRDVMETALERFMAVLDSRTLADLLEPKVQLASLFQLKDADTPVL